VFSARGRAWPAPCAGVPESQLVALAAVLLLDLAIEEESVRGLTVKESSTSFLALPARTAVRSAPLCRTAVEELQNDVLLIGDDDVGPGPL
jgi:hypothetical protein